MKNKILLTKQGIGTQAIFTASEKKEQNPDMVYFLVGATSMGYDEAVEGEAASFAVGGPGPDEPYGKVSILADGKEKASFEWGGSTSQVGSAANPPAVLELKGKTDKLLYFGVMRLNPMTGEGLLLRKGKIEPGEVSVSLTWDETDQTYKLEPDAGGNG